MSEKPKIALYWCASCGGCEEAVVDLAEKVLEVVNLVDIVFWPVALDFKLSDIEALQDASIAASLINGGIRMSEQKEVVELLRRKSKFVIAYGACSAWGGVPGLANLYDREEILTRVYLETPSTENPEKTLPQMKIKKEVVLELPDFLPSLKPINDIIEVDYYIPGCPPTPEVTWKALEALLSGNLPPRFSVIGASERALCYECRLNETKPEKVLLKEIKRPHQVVPESEKCLLTQGLLCLGPATRGGCGALCINANMPCTGCFGPLDGVKDYGAKALSFVASILDYQDEEGLKKALQNWPDLVGTLYRYTLPASCLKGKITGRRYE